MNESATSQPTGLRVSQANYVAVVTIDTPPVNALTRQLNDELTETFDRLSEDPEVRAIVLTSAGKVFCAGADLKSRQNLGNAPGALVVHLRRTRECFHAIRECAKPVIVAINGPALGAGLAIVASADVLVASDNASLGLPEIDVGLLGGCRHAMRLFSHSLLRRMALTGYRVPAEELHRRGVIEQCTTREQLLPDASSQRMACSRMAAGTWRNGITARQAHCICRRVRRVRRCAASFSSTSRARASLFARYETSEVRRSFAKCSSTMLKCPTKVS